MESEDKKLAAEERQKKKEAALRKKLIALMPGFSKKKSDPLNRLLDGAPAWVEKCFLEGFSGITGVRGLGGKKKPGLAQLAKIIGSGKMLEDLFNGNAVLSPNVAKEIREAKAQVRKVEKALAKEGKALPSNEDEDFSIIGAKAVAMMAEAGGKAGSEFTVSSVKRLEEIPMNW